MNFIERKISVKRAISVLAKSGIEVDDSEASIIGSIPKLVEQE